MLDGKALKDALLAQLDPQEVWRDLFGWESGTNVKCPRPAEHSAGEDRTASCSLSEDGKAYCHSCGFKATSPIGVVEALHEVDYGTACRLLWDRFIEPLVSEKAIKESQQRLEKELYVQTLLETRRGLRMETARKLGLGWDGRLTVPVRNEAGFCVDLRRYDLTGKAPAGFKVVSYARGYGGGRLWPLERRQQVYLFEGEMDTALAIQDGLPAHTITTGAKSWKEPWSEWFKDKDVVIVPDMDKPGWTGGTRRALEIRKVARSVSLVKLPLPGTKEDKDYTDWRLRHGGTAAALIKLAGAPAPIEAPAPQAARSGALEAMTDGEAMNMARADAAMDRLTSNGAFFKNQDGDLFYAQAGGYTMRIGAKAERFLAHMGEVSPLINSATSSGRFVLQHIANRAQLLSKSSCSGAWSMFDGGAIYVAAEGGRVLKSRGGKLEVLPNAVNEDRILLESPLPTALVRPVLDADPAQAVQDLWALLARNIPGTVSDKYLLICWYLGMFLKECVRPKPIIRLLAKTACGKSTTSKLMSVLTYGEESLQHSATTNAATYAMAQRYPLLVFDNIETRNMNASFEDFLLIAATGGTKAKRQALTDSGVVLEQASCLVLTNGIEPFAKHEIISRTIELGLDIKRFGQKEFQEMKVLERLRAERHRILCGCLRALTLHVVPRIQSGEIQRIGREFADHEKERFNEYFALMALILDAVWAYRPAPEYGLPHGMVAEWLRSQTSATQEQDEGTSDVLYFLQTFAERRDRLPDAVTQVDIRNGSITIKGTTSSLLSDFRLLARHLGIRCPWQNERQLGTRLADAETVLGQAGWTRVLKLIHGRRVYAYSREEA